MNIQFFDGFDVWKCVDMSIENEADVEEVVVARILGVLEDQRMANNLPTESIQRDDGTTKIGFRNDAIMFAKTNK
jgi:hypothetical protein